MTPYRNRLQLFLAALLAPLPLTGCLGGEAKDTDTGGTEMALDDVACLDVALGAECPDEGTASVELIGDQTCETPVREVTATGAFLYQEDVVYTGYGGYYPYETGDTGAYDTPVTRCCYEAAYEVHEGQGCTIGRPLVIDGRMVSARPTRRADWARAPRPEVRHLTESDREALAAWWTRAALLEHASVPAFARVILDLTALGAPAELLARTAAAMADEVRHAEACFAMASAYAGEPVGPGALPTPARRRPSLRRLAVEAFREGCVGESLAVAEAAEQLRAATDPAVRAVLARIVEDETAHAELAWDIVAWAIAQGGPSVRKAVAREVAALEGHSNPVLDRMIDEVLRPTAEALLAA